MICPSPQRTQRKKLFLYFLCVLCGFSCAACGRKGPPLAPIVLLPTPVGEFAAKRAGENVVLRFKIPVANTDSSTPVDLDRVEIYAHTGPLPAATDFLKFGTLIATIKMKPPVVEGAVLDNAPAVETSAPADVLEPGSAASVSEPITSALLEPGALPFARATTTVTPVADIVETPGTVNLPQPIKRYYTVVPVSRSRNRRGTFSVPVALPLVTPPSPPEGLNVSYSEAAITVVWSAMPGDRPAEEPLATLQLETPGTVDVPDTIETAGTVNLSNEIPTPSEIVPPAAGTPAPVAPVPVVPAPPVPLFGYNVYAAEPGVGEPAVAAAATPSPAIVGRPVPPLNPAMLTAQTFTDALVEFGAPRCYAVRRVELVSGAVLESPPTRPVCVTPIDTFPPAAPKQLATVSDDKGVNLIWEANTERDLAGYLVLRGEAPAETLTQLTPEPIRDTAFRDTTVQQGHAYIYAIVAVDNATSPNKSQESSRETEVIR